MKTEFLETLLLMPVLLSLPTRLSPITKITKGPVIEFVESQEIEQRLKELSYPFFGQGYYYSKAIKFDEIETKCRIVK